MTEEEAEVEFAVFLKRKGCTTCPSCNRLIDRGDVAWNEGSTSEGTPLTWVEIQCQKCETEILRFSSWYPEAETFTELVENCLEDI